MMDDASAPYMMYDDAGNMMAPYGQQNAYVSVPCLAFLASSVRFVRSVRVRVCGCAFVWCVRMCMRVSVCVCVCALNLFGGDQTSRDIVKRRALPFLSSL